MAGAGELAATADSTWGGGITGKAPKPDLEHPSLPPGDSAAPHTHPSSHLFPLFSPLPIPLLLSSPLTPPPCHCFLCLCFNVEKHPGFLPKLLSLLLLLEMVAMAFIFASNLTGHTNSRRSAVLGLDSSDREPQPVQPLARARRGGRKLGREAQPARGCK